MKNQPTFGSRFKALRMEKRLTQEKIAELFYLNTSSISKYEKDRSIPENNLLIQFADFFEVSVDYLLCRTDIPYKIEQSERGQYIRPDGERILLDAAADKMFKYYFGLPESERKEINSFVQFKALGIRDQESGARNQESGKR